MEPTVESFTNILWGSLNPISAGGGGWNPPPSRFFPCHRHKYQPIDSKLLTFKFYYRDIIWQNINFITCQGVTWSLFCQTHFVSPHIFHCIYIEFSSSTFSFFWHLYSVLISVFLGENIPLIIFVWKHWNLTKIFAVVSISEKIQNFDDFSGFCSPEFDSFLRDLAIFRSICNEQHSSIPKSQIKSFHNEIKLDLRNLQYRCWRNLDNVIVTSLIQLWRPNFAQGWFFGRYKCVPSFIVLAQL